MKYSLISFHDQFHGCQLELDDGSVWVYRFMYGDKSFAEGLVDRLNYMNEVRRNYIENLDNTELKFRMRFHGGVYEIVPKLPE